MKNKLLDVKVVHLEVTSKCQASCPMCARNIQGGLLNPFLELHEITHDQFINWFDISFIKQLDKLYMCGNYGDPIVAKDTLKIFEYIRQYNQTIQLSMNTNGSARSSNFWQSLAELNVSVRFGIDGLTDTHSRYRINTDWDKIINNATTFINAGGYAVWDMLVFEHNQHQVDSCKELSNRLGFKEFYHKHTSRFRDNKLQVIDFYGKQVDVLYPTDKSLEHKSKVNTNSKVIKCKSKNEKSIYVGANGNVTLCCWTDLEYIHHNHPSRIDFVTRLPATPNLHTKSLSDIMDSSFFIDIENTWNTDPLLECSKQCGSFKKFEAQYENLSPAG